MAKRHRIVELGDEEGGDGMFATISCGGLVGMVIAGFGIVFLAMFMGC